MKKYLRRFGLPSLLVLFAIGVFAWNVAMPAFAQVTYTWDATFTAMDDVGFGCTSNTTCAFSCNAGTVGATCVSNVCTFMGAYLCDPWWDINNCGNSKHTEWECTQHNGACVPDTSCAATTYVGNTCPDGCGGLVNGTLPYPPSASLNPPEVTITAGNSTTLSYSCTNSTTANITGIGNVTLPSGSVTVSPSSDTIYTLTCTGAGGEAYAFTLVVVQAPCSPLNGTQCTASSVCGTNTGVYDCSAACSVSAPAVPGNYGQACTSSPNICSMTNTGTYGCSSCSASTPDDSLCVAGCGVPVPTITAAPNRVSAGGTSTLTVTASGVTTSCVVTDQDANVIRTIPAATCNANAASIATPAINKQTIYTVTCDSTVSSKVIVNVNPIFKPF